jgi:hypothetical protein
MNGHLAKWGLAERSEKSTSNHCVLDFENLERVGRRDELTYEARYGDEPRMRLDRDNRVGNLLGFCGPGDKPGLHFKGVGQTGNGYAGSEFNVQPASGIDAAAQIACLRGVAIVNRPRGTEAIEKYSRPTVAHEKEHFAPACRTFRTPDACVAPGSVSGRSHQLTPETCLMGPRLSCGPKAHLF